MAQPSPPTLAQEATATVPNTPATATTTQPSKKKKERLTIAEIVQKQPTGFTRRGRIAVKEAIVNAYHLDKAVTVLQDIIDHDERLNSLLKEELTEKMESLQQERDDILDVNTDTTKFARFEIRFLEYVQYEIKKSKTASAVSPEVPQKIKRWIYAQRNRKRNYDNNEIPKALARETCAEDIAILNRIGFEWNNPFSAASKTWDDYFQLLLEFKEQHGHCKVPQVHPVMGVWIKRIRMEYEKFRVGGLRTPSLRQDRMDAMSEIGFVWKVRWGRPKKGDERFRCRRKSDAASEATNVNHATDINQDDDS